MRSRFVYPALAAVCLLPVGTAPAHQPTEFARFVDSYLDRFARRHPYRC